MSLGSDNIDGLQLKREQGLTHIIRASDNHHPCRHSRLGEQKLPHAVTPKRHTERKMLIDLPLAVSVMEEIALHQIPVAIQLALS